MATIRQLRKKAKAVNARIAAHEEQILKEKAKLAKMKQQAGELRDRELKKSLEEMIESGEILSKCKHDNWYHWEKESNGYFYSREGCSKCHEPHVYGFFGYWLSWDEKNKFQRATDHIWNKYKIQ